MEIWMIFSIIALAGIVIEIFAPTFFFINISFAAIITALVSVFDWGPLTWHIWLFLILSVLSILFVRPIIKKTLKKCQGIDFDGQYKGKVVKVIDTVTKTSGAITIYDERWEARLTEGCNEEIPTGCDVKIVSNESTVLFVERV